MIIKPPFMFENLTEGDLVVDKYSRPLWKIADLRKSDESFKLKILNEKSYANGRYNVKILNEKSYANGRYNVKDLLIFVSEIRTTHIDSWQEVLE